MTTNTSEMGARRGQNYNKHQNLGGNVSLKTTFAEVGTEQYCKAVEGDFRPGHEAPLPHPRFLLVPLARPWSRRPPRRPSTQAQVSSHQETGRFLNFMEKQQQRQPRSRQPGSKSRLSPAPSCPTSPASGTSAPAVPRVPPASRRPGRRAHAAGLARPSAEQKTPERRRPAKAGRPQFSSGLSAGGPQGCSIFSIRLKRTRALLSFSAMAK